MNHFFWVAFLAFFVVAVAFEDVKASLQNNMTDTKERDRTGKSIVLNYFKGTVNFNL
jgi:hypothetical protein